MDEPEREQFNNLLDGNANTVKRPTTPAFAVIRLDHDLRDLSASGGSTPQASVVVTVKEVLLSQSRAEAEVERLNKLNADKGCRYFWQYTRLVRDDAY